MDERFLRMQSSMMNNLQKLLEIGLGKKIDIPEAGLLETPELGRVVGEKAPMEVQSVGSSKNVEEGAQPEIGLEKPVEVPAVQANFAYKLLCPKFDGLDFAGWSSKLEQYFEAESVPEGAKIRVVMLHLEGKALQWHQYLVKTYGDLNKIGWAEYIRQLRERFTPGGFEDPFAALVALRQTDSVERFYEEFIELLNQVQLPDAYVLSMFKNHLRVEISPYVQLLQPKNLLEAFHLAKHVEAMWFPTPKPHWSQSRTVGPPPALSIHVRTSSVSVRGSPNSLGSSLGSSSKPQLLNTVSTPPIKKPASGGPRGNGKAILAAEIEERRRKGLCFWCSAKYSPGHRCAKTQLYHIMVEGVEEEGEEEAFVDCEEILEGGQEGSKGDSPILSLQAMWGSDSWETMKLKIQIRWVHCVALLNSGSTHNFLSLAMVKRAGLGMNRRCQFKVKVADGNNMETMGECNLVQWETQGLKFTTDFLVLPLKNCDAVLGIQWLSKLGAVKWDFAELTMEFEKEGKSIKLIGCKPSPVDLGVTRNMRSGFKARPNLFNVSIWYINAKLEMKGDQQQAPEALHMLLQEFSDVFGEPSGLPPERGKKHRITLMDENAVVKVKPYRYPFCQKEEIEKMVQEMLEAGIIRESNSAFSSPIVMVKKKDDSWRMCVDYRKLNQATVKDSFPMSVIEELLDELGEARIFSKLDLRFGYHQIKMWEPDIHKTSFRTHEGHYEFLVMPFGLTNAPTTFQGLMNKVFKGMLRKSVLVFFDDILVYSVDWSAHLKQLREVLEILRSNTLYAKKSKCSFGAIKIDYLGYVISNGSIAMDEGKVECILKWPRPRNLKEMRGFLGLSGYYRRFIEGYGSISRPLTDLLKKGGWKWSEKEEEAFLKLKEAICTAPTLVLPYFKEEFSVETDASEVGVEAVLTQRGKPLAYFSKGLGIKHQGLSVYEKEMLAILMAVKKWSSYLVGRHFKIKTDHQSLKFLSGNQATTLFQQKWVIKMMGYDYEIIYKKRINNIVADVLSRRPSEHGGELMAISSITTDVLDKIAATWQQDEKLKKIIEALKANSGKHPKYSWEGNLLKRKGKLVVGKDERVRKDLLNFFHESVVGGHSGAHVTMKRISEMFYWKGLRKEVKQKVRECAICQKNKDDLVHPRGLLQPLPIPDSAWSSIGMDFIEGLPISRGKDTILVVVDRLTKYGHFIGLKHPFSAKEVAQVFMENIFKLHGLPGNIICDRDRIFMSNFWQELFKCLCVRINPSTAYHPAIDGQTERLNKCLETYLRCMTGEKPKEWGNWLHLAEWWYNTSFHSAIQTTPYQALYGQIPPVHVPYVVRESRVASVDRELQDREAAMKMMKFYLSRAQERMKQQANRNRTECEYEVGDWVYLKLQPYRQQTVSQRSCQKLAPRWFGPFKILARMGKVAYELELPRDSGVHPVFHISQLKKHVGNEPCGTELPVMGPDGGISKEPVKILERRITKKDNRAVTEVLASPKMLPGSYSITYKCSFLISILEDKDAFKEWALSKDWAFSCPLDSRLPVRLYREKF